MCSTKKVFLTKIFKCATSTDPSIQSCDRGRAGFTLLELIVSLTILSLVVLVLYTAFSMGVRIFDQDNQKEDKIVRLEAALRMLQEDMMRAVPYNMNWQEGQINLFAGGPRTLFYVTGSGTGAFSGAGAGLFFSCLFVDDCPDSAEECLYLFKSSKPSPDYVQTVDRFNRSSEFQREYFVPEAKLAEKGIVVLDGVQDLNFSYSGDQFIPFAGLDEDLSGKMHGQDKLPMDHWLENELPGRIRISFSLEGKEYVVHVPVGE